MYIPPLTYLVMVDGEKEDTLKTMRKTLHCLEEIEEIIKRLREKVNTSEEVNSEGIISLYLFLFILYIGTIAKWIFHCKMM